MSKITQNYIEARRDGIKWLNSQKRDYRCEYPDPFWI